MPRSNLSEAHRKETAREQRVKLFKLKLLDAKKLPSVVDAATRANIGREYRKLAPALHPDKNMSETAEVQRARAEQFTELTEAYEALLTAPSSPVPSSQAPSSPAPPSPAPGPGRRAKRGSEEARKNARGRTEQKQARANERRKRDKADDKLLATLTDPSVLRAALLAMLKSLAVDLAWKRWSHPRDVVSLSSPSDADARGAHLPGDGEETWSGLKAASSADTADAYRKERAARAAPLRNALMEKYIEGLADNKFENFEQYLRDVLMPPNPNKPTSPDERASLIRTKYASLMRDLAPLRPAPSEPLAAAAAAASHGPEAPETTAGRDFASFFRAMQQDPARNKAPAAAAVVKLLQGPGFFQKLEEARDRLLQELEAERERRP